MPDYAFLNDLEPRAVWKHFAAISEIPRCSRHEAAVRAYVVAVADAHGLEHASDSVGNTVVRRPASPGRESSPAVCLQGHLDMVCEQNLGTNHDFERDPIRLVLEGGWLRAEGTTLGADNGIAVAMMLAALESEETFGALECLFTVDEESGLTGALQLDPSLVTARRLINLDSEEEGFICIGCAGGRNTEGTVPVVRESAPAGGEALQVKVSGLRGGHSGAEIHEGRGNAIVLGARILGRLPEGARIASLWGGDKHNAIPREFTADVLIPPDKRGAFREEVTELEALFRGELGGVEPDLAVTVAEIDPPSLVLSGTSARTVSDLLAALPHGVLGMSHDVPGLVETSTNLASIRSRNDSITILTSQRSSRMSMIDRSTGQIASIFALAGGTSVQKDGYPSWTPDPSSALLADARAVYRDLTGKTPEVGAFHAGLECGVIGYKIDGIDMISIGPDMEGVHTPDERINVASAERTYAFLLELIKR